MKSLTIVFLLLTVSGIAQSRKALNDQLSKELAEQKFLYENVMGMHRKTILQIEKKREYVNEIIDRDLKVLQDQSMELLNASREHLRILTKLGFPAVDTLAHMEKEMRQISANLNSQRELYTIQMNRDFHIDTVGEETAWVGKKIKEQNVLLQQKIELYKTVIATNQATLNSENECSADLEKLQREISTVISNQWLLRGRLGIVERKLNGQVEQERSRYLSAVDRKGFPKTYEEEFGAFLIQENATAFEFSEVDDVPEIEQEGFTVEYQTAVSDEPEPEPEVYAWVDEPAEFPGGMEALKKYLTDNLLYPPEAVAAGIEGKVYVRFIVSDQGVVSDPVVLKGIADCEACSMEAERLVLEMPVWNSGKVNGKPTHSFFTLPITFKLNR